MDATAIFTEHGVALERLAARITRDREEARDVVADAFASLLASGPAEAEHAVPWLYVTVRNNAYNRMRRQALARRRLPVLAVTTDASVHPESAVRHDPFVRTLVGTATASLNERDRIAVSMRHLEQASYADIGAALGTTPMQARVVVHRANGRLRKHVVAALAEHRGKRRAASLRSAADPGKVSDELAALLQLPAVLPCSKRFGHAVRVAWRRVESTTGRVVVQFGELVRPGVALVAMAAVAGAPIDSPPAVPSVLAANTVSPPSTAGFVPAGAERAVAGMPPSVPHSDDGALSATAASVGPTITSHLRFEDPGPPSKSDRFFDDERKSVLNVLGLPLGRIDPLELQAPEIDIRSLELATMGDAEGRPQALRWRIELAAPPTRALSYITLHWWYEDSDCFTMFEWPAAADAHVLTACPIVPVVGGIEGDKPRGYAAYESSRGRFRLDGATLEVILPFRSLDSTTREVLRPGTRLERIVAIATCPDQTLQFDRCPTRDRAPDEGAYTYRIEE